MCSQQYTSKNFGSASAGDATKLASVLADRVEQARHILIEVEAALSGDAAGELAALVGVVQRLLNTGEELHRRVVRLADREQVWAAEGFRSVGSWTAAHTCQAPAAGKRLARDARLTGELAATAGRALDGLLNTSQVRHIARCAAGAPDRFDAASDEAFSLLAACGDHAGFSQATRGWMAAVDGERGPEATSPEAHARFSMSETFEGWWHGEFLLTPEDGALLHEAIERRAGRYLRARRDGDPSVEELPMVAVRAQALVDVVDAALRADGAKRHGPDRYSIALTFRVNPDGTVASDGNVPPGAACDSSIFRLVVGAEGEVLDVGRSVRTAPPHLAAAVARRDRHCTFPGCDAPPSHCDCHHCSEWDHGGATSIDNLTLLCRWHHTFIHKHRWAVHLDEHQHPIFTKPDGTIHCIRPALLATAA